MVTLAVRKTAVVPFMAAPQDRDTSLSSSCFNTVKVICGQKDILSQHAYLTVCMLAGHLAISWRSEAHTEKRSKQPCKHMFWC